MELRDECLVYRFVDLNNLCGLTINLASGAHAGMEVEQKQGLMSTGSTYDPVTGLNDLDLPGRPESTRVVVAMSGGVDSSVVAAILAGKGYDVVGVTLQLYNHGAAVQRKGACCAGQDIHDARRVAEQIGIPHYVLDYEDRFRQAVIDDFADSYVAGETPIPCVRCNQKVKFRDLLDTARDLGADALATGHYITSRPADDGSGARHMFRAVDEDRDQSYFLFTTTPDQLNYLRFPLGEMPKIETRRIAAELGLGVADKVDSQDICFVPSGRYTSVIEKLRPEAMTAGDIVHVDGQVLGRHEGIMNYTIGQRRGLGVATGDPLFVVRLDAARAEVIVGPKEALFTRKIALRDVNWLGDAPIEEIIGDGRAVFVKIRSTQGPIPALLSAGPDGVSVTLDDGDHGVSPGQACVFYDGAEAGARVFGGGWISSTEAYGESHESSRGTTRTTERAAARTGSLAVS